MNIHLSIKKLQSYADRGITDINRIIEENRGSHHHPLYQNRDKRSLEEDAKRVVCDRFNKFRVEWSEENGIPAGDYRISFQGFYKERNTNALRKYSNVHSFIIN